MMGLITGWSIRFRLLVLGLAAATLLFAAIQVPHMPREAVPEFAPPYVEIQTEALGLSADEVEQLITVPLEADLLQGVAFLDEIHSQSVAGLSSIVMLFEPGTDIFRARQVVAERLTQAHALPNVSRPPAMIQPLSSTSRLLMVSLSSESVSLIDQSVLARWTIRPRLMSVPGVANVAVWGLRERQLQVLVDPARLRANNIDLADVIETTGNSLWVSPLTFLDASTPGTGGFIDTPNQRLGIHHIFPIDGPKELAGITIAPDDTDGRVVRLGDVATVVEDHQPLIGDAVVGDGPGLMLVIEKFPDADTLEVTRGVEAALAALAAGLDGVQVDTTVFRPATFIEEAVGNLSLAIGAGLLLGAFALFVLLRGWRPAVIAVVSIVVTLSTAILVLYAMGATVNAIVVAGLMLGAIVVIDDAIASVESIVRRMRHPTPDDAGKSARATLMDAIHEVRGGVAYAWLIVLLAITPLFLLSGVAGAFLPPLLVAYLVATLAAMLVALTVTPALASLLLSETQRPHRVHAITKRVSGAYRSVLSSLVARSRTVFAALAVVTIAVVALAGASVSGSSDTSFVPPFKERGLLIAVDGAPGTSSEEMRRVAARAGAELRSIPGVQNVGGQVGRAVTSDQVVGVNAGELWISIDPTADYDTTVAAVQDAVDGYPGLAIKMQTYTSERIDSVLATPEDDVVVRLYGQDSTLLRAKAGEVSEAMAGIDGLTAVGMEAQVDEPTLQIEVDLAAAEQFGLRPGDVRRATTTLLSGLEVGLIFEEQKVFEVVVWGVPELRHSISTIRDLPIQAADGSYVRLGDVARVEVGASPSVINREGVFRYVDVGATLSGRDLGAVLRDVDTKIAAIDFPFEYRAEVFGAAADRQATLTRIVAVTIAALIGILLLLQAAFVSWRRAVVLLVTLPAAMTGAIVGAYLVGGIASIGVIAGSVAVLAFAVRHSILMVDRYQRLEREPGAEFGLDLILGGAQERLAPILTTAAVVALVVAPFVVLGSASGLEILRPMAVVVLGGLATSTLFALFVVPAVIFRTGPSAAPETETQPIEQPGLSPA